MILPPYTTKILSHKVLELVYLFQKHFYCGRSTAKRPVAAMSVCVCAVVAVVVAAEASISGYYSLEVFKHVDVIMDNLQVFSIKHYHPQ